VEGLLVMLGHSMRICCQKRFLAAVGLSVFMIVSLAPHIEAATNEKQPTIASRIIPPLVPGDEPVVVTEHRVQTASGPLDYEARTGRIPIRDQNTGQVRGHIFFVAYVAKNRGIGRPLTFAWNGGPGAASSIIHLEGLGPRRKLGDDVVDNAETLLQTSDLVFMDAMETGFSRPETPELAKEFLNLKGDIAATVEFIRAYRDRFHSNGQPLFICGESYGVFRAAGVVDEFAKRKVKVAGAILISGDIPNIPQDDSFYDAMHVPARTATAFYYKRLDPDLMRDRDATMKAVNDWAVNVYQPALKKLDKLTPDEKEKISTDLARFIGMRPEQVDRKTLVIHVDHYLKDFFGGDGTKVLAGHDMRQLDGDEKDPFGSPALIDNYLRGELGYTTDLAYNNVDTGYAVAPGPPPERPANGFFYNLDNMSPEDKALSDKYEEVTWIAKSMPQFIPDALKRDKNLKLLVATGRFDPLNMCEGDVRVTSQLSADQSARMINRCYEAGHVMYEDEKVRPIFSSDLANFIRQTVANIPAPPAEASKAMPKA
jgi:carboxypeptidase C (cathepsin A)